MFARSTLNNYAASLPDPERQAFKDTVGALQGEMHGKVEILLSDTLVAAGLDAHVKALEANRKWLFMTNTGDELNTLFQMRHQARIA